MERELPTWNIAGTDFLVDVRKFELREKSNEKNIIFFKDMFEDDRGYFFAYNSRIKNIPKFFEHGNLQVKIPEFVNLDPVGMAQKYGLTLEDIRTKTDLDLMVDQDALHRRIVMGQLPTITIAGHIFYVNARVDHLHPKDDFKTMGICFSDIGHYFNEEKDVYTIPYNPKTHEFQEIAYDKIKEYPKDLIAVKFPHERVLDPVGWNRRYGFDETEDLKKIGLKLRFRAQTIPWHKTGIDEIIKENLKGLKPGEIKSRQQYPKLSKPEQNKGRKL